MAANPKKSVAPNALAMFNNLPSLAPQNKADALAVISSNEIRIGAFLWTPVGLQVDGEITRQDWEETGRLLQRIDVSLQWLIGDFIVAGEELNYGQQEELAQQFGFQYGTVRTYATVARNVDLSIRVDKLSFKHHQLVAALPQERQVHWLNLAAEGEDGKIWSTGRLQQEISRRNASVSEDRFLFSKDRIPKITSSLANTWAKAKRGDKKSKTKVLGAIALHRKWLDELEESLED